MTTVEAPYDAEVEYLESTGTQYIDTGVMPQNVATVRFDLSIGFKLGSSGRRFVLSDGNANVTHYAEINASDRWTTNNLQGMPILDANTIYDGWAEYSFSGATIGVLVEGNEYTISSQQHMSSEWGRLVLFRVDSNNCGSGVRIGKCKISFAASGVRDFIPVRFTNEQGVSEGAMYDKVSGQLFRNQGTGAFLYGADVRPYSTPVMGLHFMREPLTAKSYAQDGLVAMWDGIENAGWGVHDSAASTWKDLSGNGLDLTVDATCGEWLDDRIIPYPNKGCPAYRLNAANEIAGVTGTSSLFVEVVTRGPVSNDSSYHCVVGLTYFGGKYQQVGTKYAAIGQFRCAWSAPIVNQMRTFSLGMSTGYINGELITTAASTNIGTGSWGKNGSAISIAGFVSNTAGAARGYPYPYPIHAIRVYRGDLSSDAVAANYAIDKERFNLP